MIGGLLKSASRLALLAAAGLFLGGVAMPSAKAADLGGDCCADLEERVAELEATTARKGNGFFGYARRVAAWFEDKHLGRITVGRYEAAGAMGPIDLGGIGVVTGFGSVSLLQGNFNLRLSDGSFLSNIWSQFLAPAAC